MNKQYYQQRSQYMKEYYQRNKERCQLSQLKWRKKNSEYIKEYMREYMKTYRKVPYPYKGRRGIVKLEPKKDVPLVFTHKEVILKFS